MSVLTGFIIFIKTSMKGRNPNLLFYAWMSKLLAVIVF